MWCTLILSNLSYPISFHFYWLQCTKLMLSATCSSKMLHRTIRSQGQENLEAYPSTTQSLTKERAQDKWKEGDSISRTFLKYYKESAPSEEKERKGRKNPGSSIQQISHSFTVNQRTYTEPLLYFKTSALSSEWGRPGPAFMRLTF